MDAPGCAMPGMIGLRFRSACQWWEYSNSCVFNELGSKFPLLALGPLVVVLVEDVTRDVHPVRDDLLRRPVSRVFVIEPRRTPCGDRDDGHSPARSRRSCTDRCPGPRREDSHRPCRAASSGRPSGEDRVAVVLDVVLDDFRVVVDRNRPLRRLPVLQRRLGLRPMAEFETRRRRIEVVDVERSKTWRSANWRPPSVATSCSSSSLPP